VKPWPYTGIGEMERGFPFLRNFRATALRKYLLPVGAYLF
jgi:hypothetical protein